MASTDTLLPGEKGPVITPSFHTTPLTPAQAAEGHSTTTMEFPNHVHMTVSINHTIYYPKGVHEVPDHLVDHWYLKANDARVYNRPLATPARQQSPIITRQQARQQNQRPQGQRNGR